MGVILIWGFALGTLPGPLPFQRIDENTRRRLPDGAGNGDMFHDIYPMRDLAHTPSQKTVDTIKFHADISNNRLRPDWVYLLSVRNDPVDDVYTVFIRLQDVFARLGDDVIEKLERPVFFSPKDTLGVLVLAFGDFDLSSVDRM